MEQKIIRMNKKKMMINGYNQFEELVSEIQILLTIKTTDLLIILIIETIMVDKNKIIMEIKITTIIIQMKERIIITIIVEISIITNDLNIMKTKTRRLRIILNLSL
jgi:hypothetical protein